MATVWHIGWMVSIGTNLTSEMSHTNEITVTKEKEDPWKKSDMVLIQ